jgi:MFS family permease
MAITPGVAAGKAARPRASLTNEERKVIFASSLGTVFEWYDFYLYGALAAIIGKQFFLGDPTTSFIFALLTFAAGFLVRPFGALVFGRLGDMIGRKYTFLVTILIMGARPSSSACCPATPRSASRRRSRWFCSACCRAWPWAANTAAPPPMSPSTPRKAGAAASPPGSRPPRPWACSCRCW